MRALAVLAVAVACGGAQYPLPPAGSINEHHEGADDGAGLLAQASIQFYREESDDDDLFARSGPRRRDGRAGGGDAYGGAGYGAFVVPVWPAVPVSRAPNYVQRAALYGAIEGVVTWRGAPPASVTSACGAVASIRIGEGRAIGDVVVYIARVQIGRTLPNDGRPISVGGSVVKRGCAFAPRVQVVTPLPSAVTIDSGTKPACVRVTSPKGPPRSFVLEAAGRAGMQVAAGPMRIEDASGATGAAWVLGLETPYYAITDDRGRFRIDELAAGTYEVTIWHAPIARLVGGKLAYGAPLIARRSVRVDPSKPARLDVALGR